MQKVWIEHLSKEDYEKIYKEVWDDGGYENTYRKRSFLESYPTTKEVSEYFIKEIDRSQKKISKYREMLNYLIKLEEKNGEYTRTVK